MQSPSFSGSKLFLQTCLLQWFSNHRFGGIKFLLVPSISLCRSPLYSPACSPLNHLSHFCWQKFIHFQDNSTFISILHSFLSPPGTSRCFFLRASQPVILHLSSLQKGFLRIRFATLSDSFSANLQVPWRQEPFSIYRYTPRA